MKTLLISILICGSLQAQTFKEKMIQYAEVSPYMIISGLGSAIKFNTSPLNGHKFMDRFPNANPMYWGPKSYLGKWKPVRDFSIEELYLLSDEEIIATDAKGNRIEAFPGSSTVFVTVTDAWHTFQAVDVLALSIGYYKLGRKIDRDQHWIWYVGDIVIPAAIRSTSFELGNRYFND